jgi:hypothetical protein
LLLIFPFAPTGIFVTNQGDNQKSIVYEDFSAYTPGEYPEGLKWRKGRKRGDVKKAKKDNIDIFRYVIQEEEGNKYLHIRDEYRPGHAVSVIIETKKPKWELEKYPVLRWRWRVNEVPPGADERFTEKNDSAAGVAIVYGKKFPFIPITIKYVWSSTLPIGAVAYRPGKGRARVIVLGSGSDRLGEWITIERNVYEDYVEIFNKKPPKTPGAIVIQSDSNRTPGGAADADYDDFTVLSSYSEGFPQEPLKLLKQYMEGNK